MNSERVENASQRPAQVVTINLKDTVATAAKRMWENRIGCLVVVDERGRLTGILSERDAITLLGAHSIDPSTKLVRDFMTRDVASCAPGTPMRRVQEIMTSRRIRHLPVVEGEAPVGMISTRDVMAHQYAQDVETRNLTIFAMAKLAESRDPETGGHLERVCAYARELAAAMAEQQGKSADAIDKSFIQHIYATSSLHDIGKVSIPDHILLKPGRLDDAEFEIMKTHSKTGAETLDSALKVFPEAEFLRMGRAIAAYHHERVDGKGYPEGLVGEQIPLSARIFALADVYDALVSKRVYKDSFTHSVARNIIHQGEGTQFDPDVVEAFLRSEQKFAAIRNQHSDKQAAA